MSPEQAIEKEGEVSFTGEVQKLKMLIQKQVISHFCGGDIHNTQKVDTWIQDFSDSYHQVFKRKVQNEEGFLERARAHTDEVAQEIISELESRSSATN